MRRSLCGRNLDGEWMDGEQRSLGQSGGLEVRCSDVIRDRMISQSLCEIKKVLLHGNTSCFFGVRLLLSAECNDQV